MQFGYCFMVLANEHIRVGLQYGHILGYIFDTFDTLSQNGLYSRVEIWSKDRYLENSDFDDMDEIADHMAELGIGI